MASERTPNSVPTLVAKSNAADNADVLLWSDPSTHRLLVDANVSISGLTAVDDSAFTAGTGTGVPMMGFATADSVDSGDVGVVAMTTARALHVQVKGNDVDFSIVDDAAFTPATSRVGMIGATFDDTTPDSVDEGDGGAVRMSANRNLYITIRDSAGNERGVTVNASNQLAVAGPVTNAGTFVVQENGAALTALQLIDDVIFTDDTAFTPATSKVAMIGAEFDDAAPDSVDEGDAGALRMSGRRELYIQLRDAAGNERGANVNALGQLAIAGPVTNAGTFAVQVDGAALTALQLIDDTIFTDDAAFTPATSKVQSIGFIVDDTASDSVDEGDIGAPRMSADRVIYIQGPVANDAADSGNPVKVGGQARTTNPTAVADADRVNFIADKLGKQVVVGSVRDLKAQQITTITSSTSETTVVTAVASTFMDVYGVIVVNSSATASNISFKDATAGTTRFNIYVPAGETRGFMLNESAAINQATVNNNWTATSSASVASIIITMLTVKNI